MPRRKGKEALYTRVVQGDHLKDKHSRAARKAQLLRETDGSTHWTGCVNCHPLCAELRLIDEIDAADDDLSLADDVKDC